jgi:putative DNA primase/helicase
MGIYVRPGLMHGTPDGELGGLIEKYRGMKCVYGEYDEKALCFYCSKNLSGEAVLFWGWAHGYHPSPWLLLGDGHAAVPGSARGAVWNGLSGDPQRLSSPTVPGEDERGAGEMDPVAEAAGCDARLQRRGAVMKDLLSALFSKALTPGLGINIRAVPHGAGYPVNKFYKSVDEAVAAGSGELAQLNETLSVYVGMALRDMGHEKPGTQDACAAIVSLWQDWDAKDVLDVANERAVTPQERETGKVILLQKLKASGLPQPSAIVDTGGGLQPHYFLRAPLRLGVHVETEAIEATLRGISRVMGVPCSRPNVDSIMRLPGFVNRKYPDGPVAQIYGTIKPELVYTLEDFAAFREPTVIGSADTHPGYGPRQSPADPNAGRDFPKLLAWMRGKGWIGKKRGDSYEVKRCPWADAHTSESGPSTTVLRLPSEENGYAGGYDCKHGHCTDPKRTIRDVYLMWRAETAVGGEPVVNATKGKRSIRIIRANTVKPTEYLWLWPGRFAQGELHMLSGDMDLGKGLLTILLIAHITTGKAWPDDLSQREPRNVIVLSAEDSRESTLVPRLIAAGADMDRVDFVDMTVDIEGSEDGMLDIRTDIPGLEDLARETRAALIVVDPINGYLGNSDTFTDNVVRHTIQPLREMAQRTRMAVLMLMHLNKDSKKSAVYRSMGSVAFMALVRACYCLARDPNVEDEQDPRRLFLQVKKNISAFSPGMVLRIEAAGVQTADGGTMSTARIVWTDETTTVTANQALSGPKRKGKREDERIELAVDFLEAELSVGPQVSKELVSRAKKVGVSEGTLWRAKKMMAGVNGGVIASKGGFGAGGEWMWRLAPNYVPMAQREAGDAL